MLIRNKQEEMIDCRPSDGIALIAIRCESEIFLERAVAKRSSGIFNSELPVYRVAGVPFMAENRSNEPNTDYIDSGC